MYTITTKHDGTVVCLSATMPEKDKEIIKFAASAYGFILPRCQTFSFVQFAEEIARVYSTDDPINAEVVATLKKYTETMPLEPPDNPHIFNRRQEDGTFRPLSEFFDR